MENLDELFASHGYRREGLYHYTERLKLLRSISIQFMSGVHEMYASRDGVSNIPEVPYVAYLERGYTADGKVTYFPFIPSDVERELGEKMLHQYSRS